MIFAITQEDIERLSDSDLRTLVGLLCEQETIRAGKSAAGVTYGGSQEASDGGTDVRVDVQFAISGHVPRSQTIFQCKAEDMPASKIEAEMKFKGQLRDSIKELGAKNGSYVIVSSKGSTSDTALTRRRNAMAAAIVGVPEAAGLMLDFYDRQRVTTWVNQHPGLVPLVREMVGRPLSGWRPYADWSSAPEPLDRPYFLDKNVRLIEVRANNDGLQSLDGIQRLREILSQPKGIVRLVGLSGVGKTRLVQALFDNQIGVDALNAPLAIYADRGFDISPAPQELLANLQHLNQRCVIIIDNCGTELHQKLSAQIIASGGQVSLITVEYDISDDEPEKTNVFRVEPASSEVIASILDRRYPHLTAPEVSTIAAFSEGNSRVALALAETAEAGISLANLTDTQLFERLFKQKKGDNPSLMRAAQALSLVYSFDGETFEGKEAELPILAGLISQTTDEIYEHVAELHRRQLVQKRGKWRAVLPHALAHRLAKTALQNLSPSKINAAFLGVTTPERLQKSFTRRIGYLHDSKEAQGFVSGWIALGGWLSQLETFNDFGMQAFENIAPVDPAGALTAIEAASLRSAGFLTDANDNRDDFVRLLRSLAYDDDKFDRAIALIGRYAEPKSKSNNMGNAANVFASLFHLYLSGTHATPARRANKAKELWNSLDRHERALGRIALDAMLEENVSSSHSFEFGTRKRDYGYWPKSRGEEKEWYREILRVCGECAKQGAKQRADIKDLLADNVSRLATVLGADDELVSLVQDFASDGWPEGWAGVRKALRRYRAAKRVDDAAKLEKLAGMLAPTTLSQKITCYLMPDNFTSRDLVDVEVDSGQADLSKAFEKAQAEVDAVCEAMGVELANNIRELKEHLPLLMSAKAHRIGKFALSLGGSASDPRALWGAILEAVDGGNWESLHLVSCAIHGIAKSDRDLADRLMDESLQVEKLHSNIVHMQMMIDVDEAGVQRMIAASKLLTVPTFSFRNLGIGRSTDALNGSQFKRLVLAIAERDDGLATAFDVLHMRIYSLGSDEKKLGKPERKLGAMLLSRLSFEDEQRRGNNQDDHHIAIVVRGCLTGAEDEAVAREVCQKLLAGIARRRVYAMDHSELVQALAEKFPEVVLDELVERGDAAGESRRSMFSGFRDHRPDPLAKISPDVLLGWAKKKPETRFMHLAEAIRPWNRSDQGAVEGWTTTALRIIREAPNAEPILNMFYDRLRPTSYSLLSASMSERLPLLEFLQTSELEAVAEWATKAVQTYLASIESVRLAEEKESRERDEKFE